MLAMMKRSGKKTEMKVVPVLDSEDPAYWLSVGMRVVPVT
jgi:hypothetical protein